jgi:hypothetical protein
MILQKLAQPSCSVQLEGSILRAFFSQPDLMPNPYSLHVLKSLQPKPNERLASPRDRRPKMFPADGEATEREISTPKNIE